MSFDQNLFHQVTVERGPISAVFTVPRRYSNLSFLSAGAQGIVVKADDTVTNTPVAIKKIVHPFLTTMTAKRTYREFVLLTTMRHPNIIALKSAFTPESSLADFEDIYLVMELMSYNLNQDLKPSNIVVNGECILKILDFGLARKIETAERMSIYVVTRHYRAPEIILGLPYDEKGSLFAF